MPEHSLIIYTDGSSRGNPGPAGIGIAVYLRGDDRPIVEISKDIGSTTNNVAEYEAVIHALRWLHTVTFQEAIIKLDSELIYEQIAGTYRVRTAHLRDQLARVRQLMEKLHDIRFILIPRDDNKTANRLAQRASKKIAQHRSRETHNRPQ